MKLDEFLNMNLEFFTCKCRWRELDVFSVRCLAYSKAFPIKPFMCWYFSMTYVCNHWLWKKHKYWKCTLIHKHNSNYLWHSTDSQWPILYNDLMYVDVNIWILTQKQHKQEQDEPILLSIDPWPAGNSGWDW